MFGIEKMESKKLKTFQKLLEISESPQYNQSRLSQSSRRNVYEETDQELDISGNTGRYPCLNNSSEEANYHLYIWK